MTIIRITEGVSGIKEYLESGKKINRHEHRDVLDRRVPIYGDLTVFTAATEYTRRYRDWKRNFWHITISPAWEDHDMPQSTLRQIAIYTLNFYFHLYPHGRLAAYGEIHYPKIQSVVDPKTLVTKQRLPHVHLAICKLDMCSDNQIRILPYDRAVSAAFQAWINAMFGSGGEKFSPEFIRNREIVDKHLAWHRQQNHVDIDNTPYSIGSILESAAAWNTPTNKPAENRVPKIPRSQKKSVDQPFNAIVGFWGRLANMKTWFAIRDMRGILDESASMTVILAAAIDQFGVVPEFFRIENQDKKILDIRTGKTYGVMNFAHGILNMDFDEAVKWVSDLHPAIDEPVFEEFPAPGG